MARLVRWLAAVLLAASGAAGAQTFPSKPVRMVVPFPAGGAADAVARLVAQNLAQPLGQPVLVENRPGADGAIAAESVIKSPPDGHTLFYGTNTAVVAVPVTRKSPPYDPREAFTPVGLVNRFVFFLFSHPSVPATSAKELVDYARANPGKLNYGTGNSTAIVATAQLAKLNGLQMLHVPYKGDAPMITDFAAGRVQLAFSTTATALNLARDGRLRVLAALNPRRSPVVPEVPTLAEAGLPPIPLTPWGALFGPANLPRDIVDRLNRDLNSVLARPELREQMARQLTEAEGSTPEALGAFVREQLALWGQAVKDAGIQPE